MSVDSATIMIIFSILTPMFGGFAWILHRFSKIDDRLTKIEERLSSLDNRITVIETVLSMMGMPVKLHNKQLDQA